MDHLQDFFSCTAAVRCGARSDNCCAWQGQVKPFFGKEKARQEKRRALLLDWVLVGRLSLRPPFPDRKGLSSNIEAGGRKEHRRLT
jgi:hypothetical protein